MSPRENATKDRIGFARGARASSALFAGATFALMSLAGQASDPPSLVGPTWVAVELAGMPVPAEPVAQQPTIQFVANGRVAEHGSHRTLLARGGRYAEMFELQASTYR